MKIHTALMNYTPHGAVLVFFRGYKCQIYHFGGKDVYLGVLLYQLGTTMVDVTDLEHPFLPCPIFIPWQLFIVRQEVMGLVPAEPLD